LIKNEKRSVKMFSRFSIYSNSEYDPYEIKRYSKLSKVIMTV